MILFGAEAILASSNSKVWTMSSFDRTRSFFLIIHWINHLHFFDPMHGSKKENVNKYIPRSWTFFFQQANVAVGVGTLSKWSSQICSLRWSAEKLCENRPSTGSNEFPADGPDCNPGVKTVSGIWRSSHVTGPSVLVHTGVSSVTLENPRIAFSWIRWRRRRLVDLQKSFPIYPANSKYLAADYCGLAISLDHDKMEIMPVDWERGMVRCVLTRHR